MVFGLESMTEEKESAWDKLEIRVCDLIERAGNNRHVTNVEKVLGLSKCGVSVRS